jgi:hypothetical protein
MSDDRLYFCDICGMKTYANGILGKCSSCGRFVCPKCGFIINARVYCRYHADAVEQKQQAQPEPLIDKLARWVSLNRK